LIPNSNQYPGPAWNALPWGLSVDGQAGGNSRTIPQGDSPDGQLNLGQGPHVQPPQPAYGQNDVRSILQALIGQMHGQSFDPGVRPQTGTPAGQPQPWDTHHGMVNAASNLAKFLAQQHTAGLRRYNGRH
jgi:hypothetical protein